MAKITAVVLDKNQDQREDLRNRLACCGVLPICFKDEWICLENIHHIRPGLAILGTDSYEQASRFVNLSKAIESNLPIIVLSNNNDIEHFIRNNWLVNLFFLRYPADGKEFQRAMDLLAMAKKDCDQPVLIAGSSERKKLLQGIPLLGLSKEPILIQGEQGAGKKLIARAIHGFSMAKTAALEFIDAEDISGPWIRDNIERADEANLETRRQPVNVIENVENLTFSIQSQLLSLIEGFNGNGIGGKRDRTSAPFITLSSCDLELLAHNGGFRKDLYHRLSVLKLTVPPLRGHSADIRAISEYFAVHCGIHHNGGICRLSDEVLDVLEDCRWPGNVSELKHLVEHLMLIDKANWMSAMPIPDRGEKQKRPKQPLNDYIDASDIRNYLRDNEGVSLKKAKARYAMQVEKKFMTAALAQTKGNCKKAAGLLNISYKTMLNKVKEYRLV